MIQRHFGYVMLTIKIVSLNVFKSQNSLTVTNMSWQWIADDRSCDCESSLRKFSPCSLGVLIQWPTVVSIVGLVCLCPIYSIHDITGLKYVTEI